jgi:hypothetical protein
MAPLMQPFPPTGSTEVPWEMFLFFLRRVAPSSEHYSCARHDSSTCPLISECTTWLLEASIHKAWVHYHLDPASPFGMRVAIEPWGDFGHTYYSEILRASAHDLLFATRLAETVDRSNERGAVNVAELEHHTTFVDPSDIVSMTHRLEHVSLQELAALPTSVSSSLPVSDAVHHASDRVLAYHDMVTAMEHAQLHDGF